MDSEKTKTAVDAAQPSPELRLLDRRAFIGFPPLALAPGIAITEFALQIPDVSFPFNLSGGPARYQRKTLQLGFLELQVDAEVISRKVQELSDRLLELEELKLFFRPGYFEGQGRLKGPERTPATFKVAFDGDGDRLAVYVYDVRLYGFSATPAAQIPALVSRAVAELDLLPGVELRGATGFTARILPPLCQAAAVSRGYKLPSLDQARLSAAEISQKGLKLRFSSGGLPPPSNPDEELLLALEGSRTFADAEQLVAQGKLAEARAAYLKLGDVQDAHPFAAERLLTLLVADPQAQELALDVAAATLRRRERSATALWAEAVVRERRGEAARAAERFLALCSLARRGQEDSSAFFAAEAAARTAGDEAPQLKVKALHELLGVRPDHLPSLQLLARASDQAQDRAGAIRAYRRIAALARDPREAAEAHVQLARLCAETEDDVAGARLHCDAALKLSPDHPEALLRLGELCHRAGEHLRGLKALDRLREVAMARHEIDLVGRSSLGAGRIWDEGLGQLENALLRFREAASLLPNEPEPHFLAARAAERLQKLQEAISGFQQCIELAGPAPKSDAVRKAAHASHHALARLSRTRLADPASAREHLEAALALDPRDMVALEELIPYFRATGKAEELADACQKAAAATEDPSRRAIYWAEAGELYRGRLGDAEKAERLLNAAVEADPKSRVALEGLLALAESRRDGSQLCRCLKALAELTADPKERARLFRRLAVAARDLAFDLDLAAQALAEVIKVEPEDLSALGELCGLHRKRADMAGLALALEQRARIAEAQGDKRLASAALREMSQVLELRLGRVGEALVALEKAARLAPEHGVLLELADLSLRCERPDHARKALEDLLSQLPERAAPERIAEIRSRLGKACELVGDREGAKAHYAAAFPARKLDDALAARLEVLYQDSGQSRELGELWAERARALMEAQRRETAAPLFLRSARALLDLGDREGALARLGAALDAAPEGPNAAEILELMATLELERGAKLEASGLLARRAAFLPRGRDPARLLVQAAGLCPGTPRELDYLTQAIDQDPGFAPVRVRRAELAADSDAVAALADLEMALAAPALDPDSPSAADRVRLARKAATAARRAGRGDVARKHLSAYVAEHPDDLDAQLELGGLHRHAGAREALCDLLGGLWRRLTGEAQRSALREYAELSIELSRTHSAVEALRSLLSRDPEDAWAVRALLGLLPDTSPTAAEDAERLHLYGVLIAHAPRDEKADLLARRAALHRAAGRWDEARADFLAAAELSAHPRELLRGAAEAARALGDERGEISTWRAAVARDPAFGEEARDRLLALARARLEAKDALSARAAYEAALAGNLAPEVRADAQLGLARAALAQGDRPGALAALSAASADGPSRKRVEAALELADLHEKAGALQEAGQALELALALSPRHAAATDRLQHVLRALEDWQGLAELLAAEARNAPKAKAIELLLELAQLYEERLDLLAPAEAALRRIVQLDPSRGDVWARLAGLLFDRGEVEEGAEALEQAAAEAGDGAPELLWGGAEACSDAGQPELALRLARKAAALEDPEGPDALLLARLLYQAGARGEAFPVFEALSRATSFEGDPDTAEEVRLSLADLALERGDVHRAERALRAILEARPQSAPAAERLAELLHARSPRDAIEVLVAHAFALAAPHRATERLLWLAQRAERELADRELAVRCLTRAAEISPEPIGVHRRLAELYRAAGRLHELEDELDALVELSLGAGDPHAAIEALEERAHLAEEGGRIDSALSTLERARALWEEQGSKSSAAAIERRRAELLRDAKLDLAGAALALERAFALVPEAETAQLALVLARRREDHRAEASWLRRAIDLTADPRARGTLWLDLSRLFDGALASPKDAEAAVREALRSAPELPGAEALLVRLLEREGRVAELAAFYEESAGRAPDVQARSRLFRRAAEIYRTRAKDPSAAATALLAARAATPDDLAVTAQAADLLHEVGRRDEAAEFDAILLSANPLRDAVFDRHRAYLEATGDSAAAGELWVRRAEREEPRAAAESYLEAAQAFRAAGAQDRVATCEERAFEADPANSAAYARVCAKAKGDVRKLSELMAARAHALGGEARAGLLRERAQLLLDSAEELLAAEAFDDLLAVAGEDIPALMARAELAAKSGGPAAAEPYDRRALAAGGTGLPDAAKLKIRLRLGSASLAKGAFRDAADAFEAVVALDPSGERGREALSLLSEVYARTQDTQGLYRTSLALAERARPAEADALLRRAADLYEDPAQAIDALLPLARSHPADSALVDRAAAGLAALARSAELIELFERGAEAAGGARAAELLLAAAKVASDELGDPERAAALTERAAAKDPANLPALRAVLAQQRLRGETPGLVVALERVIDATEDGEERAKLRLELAQLALSLADRAKAHAALSAVMAQGPAVSAYRPAVEQLARLLADGGDRAELGRVLAARADLASGAERAELLVLAAKAFQEGGDLEAAAERVQAAVELVPSLESFVLLAGLSRELGRHLPAAEALEKAAERSSPEARAPFLVEAAGEREAAGDKGRAAELLELAAEAAPSLLPPEQLASRLVKLGAHARAAVVGFAPAMAAGDFDRALSLAEAAGDVAKVRRALWAMMERGGAGGPPVPELAARLREGAGPDELLRLAGACEKRLPELAPVLYEAVASQPSSGAALRSPAVDRLLDLSGTAAVVERLLPALAEEGALVDRVLSRCRAAQGAERVELLRAAASALPSRGKSLLAEALEQARAEGAAQLSAELAGALVALEEDPKARAALWAQAGEIRAKGLADLEGARGAYEQALEADGESVAALRGLLELEDPAKPARILELAGRLQALAGAAVASEYGEKLAGAYERTGRRAEAYEALGALPETPERLERRAHLAGLLGRAGESLQLRERFTTDPVQLERILYGYVEAGLHAFASRLGAKLDPAKLAPQTRRFVAESLSSSRDGAALAARFWPDLLRAGVNDADGWTLFAEALRHDGREEQAALVDGLGAALTSSAAATVPPVISALRRKEEPPFDATPASRLVPITDLTMPRLYAALSSALAQLGAGNVLLSLCPEGGVEAYLARPEELVVGAAALTVFGPGEMAYLMALALALGSRGAALAHPGEPAGFPEAAAEAIASVPGSLAAGRVLAHLDASVRGGDPLAVDVAAVLRKSAAFRAVALKILDLV